MNNLNMRILREDDDFSSVFQKYGKAAAITDFAILLNAFSIRDGIHGSYKYIKNNNELSGRTSWQWLENGRIICSNGELKNFTYNYQERGGARLVIPASVVQKNVNTTGEYLYGEYPQMVVTSDNVCNDLNDAYEDNRLKITGKKYTTDFYGYRDVERPFIARTFPEYEYNNGKYIRFCYESSDGLTLSNGKKYKSFDAIWIRVTPIKWFMSDDGTKLISEKIIFSGIRYCDRYKKIDSFEDTEISEFIDKYLSSEIQPINTIISNDINDFLENFNEKKLEKVKKKLQKKLDEFYKNVEQEMLDNLFGSNCDELSELSNKVYKQSIIEIEKKLDEFKQEQLVKINDETHNVEQELLKKMKELKKMMSSKESVFEYANQKLDSVVSEYAQSLEETKNKLMLELSNLMKDNFIKLQEEFDKLSGRINNEIKKLDNKAKQLKTLSSDVDKELERITNEKEKLEEKIVSETIKQLVELNPAKEVSITIDNVKKKGFKGLFHHDFEAILQLVSIKLPIFLVGPAGCGKNVILKQCSEALGKKFYYQNDADEDHKLLGFVDANGIYHKTPFYNAFTEGGILMLDEMDNSNASVLLKLNSAIGSGNDFYMTFPNGETKAAHKDFQVVAAANTYGTGSNRIYCGRNQIDGATLDRYFVYNLDYDRRLEQALVTNKDILGLFWNVRDIVRENDIRHTVSTRAILNMDKIISSKIIGKGSFTIGNAFEGTLIKGLDVEDLNIIVSKLSSTDIYTQELLNFLRYKYGVDKNAYRNAHKRDYVYEEDEEEKDYKRYVFEKRDRYNNNFDNDDDYDDDYNRRWGY